MNKVKVNEDDYIALCNQELQNHSDFQEGMKIIGVPPGKSGSDLTGYNWEGPSAVMAMLVSSVVGKIREKYELDVSQNN